VGVKLDGKVHIVDGHHRAAAAVSNNKSIEMYVFDGKRLERVAKLAGTITQSAAGYLDQSPYDDRSCTGCKMFRKSDKFLGSCTLVEGSISPRGWCRHWDKKQGR
jgi:hypothetical protein